MSSSRERDETRKKQTPMLQISYDTVHSEDDMWDELSCRRLHMSLPLTLERVEILQDQSELKLFLVRVLRREDKRIDWFWMQEPLFIVHLYGWEFLPRLIPNGNAQLLPHTPLGNGASPMVAKDTRFLVYQTWCWWYFRHWRYQHQYQLSILSSRISKLVNGIGYAASKVRDGTKASSLKLFVPSS